MKNKFICHSQHYKSNPSIHKSNPSIRKYPKPSKISFTKFFVIMKV